MKHSDYRVIINKFSSFIDWFSHLPSTHLCIEYVPLFSIRTSDATQLPKLNKIMGN